VLVYVSENMCIIGEGGGNIVWTRAPKINTKCMSEEAAEGGASSSFPRMGGLRGGVVTKKGLAATTELDR